MNKNIDAEINDLLGRIEKLKNTLEYLQRNVKLADNDPRYAADLKVAQSYISQYRSL